MKAKFLAMAVVGVMGVITANATPVNPTAREVMIGVSDAFMPDGFDSSEEAYVVESGVFQNGCYRWSRAEVKHISTFEHEVFSFAIVQPGMCIMVLVPFTKDVKLGKLATGTHKIRFMNGDDTYLEKQLVIQ